MSGTSSFEPIAVIALAGRFPGADTLDAFWENLRRGVESISWFSDDELRAAGVDAASARDPRYVKAGAVLPGAELFDARFFGYLPREAAMLDPQHRLFLECAWELLETGGYDPDRYPGTIGIFGGVATNSYLVNHLCQSPAFQADRAGFDTMVANDKDYVTTRVAYELNLRGPALTVQTACSTSLVAVHLACQHLWTVQCDMAIAGAAAIRCPQTAGYLYKDGMILSPDGHTRSFDARGQGTVMGSGVGLALLKRLSDALADGDRILAVIRSSAVNNDGGSKAGYTAPSVQGQADVIAMTHQLAEIRADSITYVEAHGTATAVGDPIELNALTEAFRATTAATRFCAIGSVKTNIGHADAAAGMAGLIKTVLALDRGELPPSLHFEQPNPNVDLENSPFYVNTALVPWQTGPDRRRAGVSSFGIGGTNAHVVLEEAPAADPSAPAAPWQLLIVSAKTATARDAAAANLAAFLDSHADANLADVAWTLDVGRKPFPYRRAVVVRDRADAIAALATPSRAIDATVGAIRPAAIFLLPGQGVQRPNMGRELFETERVFRETFAACASRLAPHLGVDLTTLVYPDDSAVGFAAAALDQTSMAQPALFVVEYALVQLLKSWGLQAGAMIGHSLGEYVAACEAGVIALDAALVLVAARGRLMQQQAPGAMLAVGLPADRLEPRLDAALSIAVINAPSQSVVSGPFAAIERLAEALAREGITSRRLATSHAFHSGMMDGAADAFRACVAATKLAPPRIPFVSNVTGTWITDAQATDPGYWVEHLRRTVRFADGLRTLQHDRDAIWLEVGPGRTLGALARQQGVPSVLSLLSSLPHAPERSPRQHVLGLMGTLWAHGLTSHLPSDDSDPPRRRVALPTYPFERQRCWIDPPTTIERGIAGGGNEPLDVDPRLAVTDGSPAARVSTSVERALCRVLQDISGLDAAAIDVTATFLDLGFDSLLLTQAAQAFQKACGVPITFRQLFSTTPSVASLATFIESERARTPASTATDDVGPCASAVDPAPARPDASALAAFGPGERRSDVALTPRQQRHLRLLVARYTARTAGSKRLTQEYRSVHADPRTAAGFNALWKELVYPIVVVRSQGSRLWDVDGNEYIDLLNGFGPNFLGHASPIVTDAIRAQLDRGIEIGPQSPLAGQVARLICELTGMERASFVNTGSEAVQAAIRLARTVTGRQTIVVFSGDYHGNFDEVLVRAAHSHRHAAVPSAPGIPPEAVANVLVLDYGASEALDVIRARASDIAAVLVEPVQSRRPEFQPREFIHELRRLTCEAGTVLIFDEVITGFRTGPGGAQAFYGIDADLATYGKVAGGGMPIGVVAGKAALMDTFDGGMWQYGDDSVPEQGVTFFAGTFVRHPLAMAAALATLTYLKDQGPDLWRNLNARTARLATTLDQLAVDGQLPFRVPCFSSLFYVRLQPEPKLANLLFFHLRERGIYLQEGFPSYLTLAHSDADIDRVVEAFRDSAAELHANECFAAPAAASVVARGVAGLDVDETGESSTFPLTEAQAEIWLATRGGPLASTAFNESCVLHLRGPLRREILRQALADVVGRHEALRTTIAGDGLMQHVAARATIDLDERPDPSTNAPFGETDVAALLARDGLTPFDLERGPLVRATLLRVAPHDHILVFTTHHIICDGLSTTRLLTEIGARYGALVAAPAAPLPPATPFRALAAWQARYAGSPEGEAVEAYWLETLRGDVPVLDLPLDRPRPPQRTQRGAREELAIDADLLDRLKRLSADAGCTLVAAQLAIFEVLLQRLTGQTDFILGLPAAEHTVLGTTDLVGHGTNLLPLRVTIEPNRPFRDHLERVKDRLLDAAEHRHVTYGRLLRRLRLARQAGRLPLVEVLFNIDRLDDGLRFDGLDVTVVDNERRAFNFDFGLNCVQSDRTLVLQGDYNADLFEADTIARWLGHFRTLLAAVVSDATCAVGALPLLTPAERERLIVDWNQTAVEYSAPERG